jgi:hypothetical protein
MMEEHPSDAVREHRRDPGLAGRGRDRRSRKIRSRLHG